MPLLTPTPNHQDYLSTHATFGAAAGAIIALQNGGDAVNISLSSNVTVDNVGVVTRRITSIKQAVKENGDSRVFGGVGIPSFPRPSSPPFFRKGLKTRMVHFFIFYFCADFLP